MIYVHVKSQEEVKFKTLGVMESDQTPVAIYEHRGQTWVRPAADFFDGRFVTKEAWDKMKSEAAAEKTAAVLRPSRKRE